MRVPEVRAAILVAAAVVLFGGCSSASGPGGSDTAPSNARGPSADGGASDATGAGSAPAPSAGGDPTTNACGLLTAEEIQQATGIAVGPEPSRTATTSPIANGRARRATPSRWTDGFDV